MAKQTLTPELIRKATRPSPAADIAVNELFLTLAEAFNAAIKELTAAPVRIEHDGVAIATREAPIPDGCTVKLVSSRGVLAPCLLADRATVMALCEAAFGGTGAEPPFDGADRPFSKTERRLRETLLDRLATRIPDVLGRCFGEVFSPAIEDDKKPLPREMVPTSYVAGRYLMHVFGYSGEINLLLPEDEIVALLAGPRVTGETPHPAPAAGRYMTKLQEAEIKLIALLPAEQRPLADVANLQPGQLLKLGGRAGEVVEIKAAGRLLHFARMVPGDEHIRLEIVDC